MAVMQLECFQNPTPSREPAPKGVADQTENALAYHIGLLFLSLWKSGKFCLCRDLHLKDKMLCSNVSQAKHATSVSQRLPTGLFPETFTPPAVSASSSSNLASGCAQ